MQLQHKRAQQSQLILGVSANKHLVHKLLRARDLFFKRFFLASVQLVCDKIIKLEKKIKEAIKDR